MDKITNPSADIYEILYQGRRTYGTRVTCGTQPITFNTALIQVLNQNRVKLRKMHAFRLAEFF